MSSKLIIKDEDLTYYLPLLALLIAGREFYGTGFFTLLITALILLSIIKNSINIMQNANFTHLILFVSLLIFSLLSYFSEKLWSHNFSLQNLIEDLYALFILVFFFFVSKYLFSSFKLTSSSLSNPSVHKLKYYLYFGLIINLIICISIYGFEFSNVFFQRLWNTYAIAFIVIAFLFFHHYISVLKAFTGIILVFIFATSSQTLLISIIAFSLLIAPNFIIKKINFTAIAAISFIALIILQIYFLLIDPNILNNIDHNFAVRSIFWKEAYEAFILNPFNFNIGVSVISGDMSTINEGAFQGGGDYTDLGVHSGIMSILYKFGIFSFSIFLWVIYVVLRIKNDNLTIPEKKFLIFTLFLFLLNLFANDSIFTPHFSASTGFMLGIFIAFLNKTYGINRI
jgi:hypothetical protein